MNIKKILVGSVASLLLLGSMIAPAFAASSISNGSFETGTTPGAYMTLSAGDSTTIPGWKVVSGSVDYIGTYWTASDGVRSIDMSGNQAGVISQTFSTTIGHTYTVTFDMAGNPDGGAGVKTMNVDAGGSPTAYSFDTTGHTRTSMGWIKKNYMFVASSTSTTLTFTSTINTPYGPALDNVVVTTAPTNEDQCKNNGWMTFNNPSFAHQGECIKYVEAHEGNIVGNPEYSAYGLHRQIQFAAQEQDLNTHAANGWLQYTDANHDHYVVQVLYLHVVGNNAYFAGKVITASNPAWVGNWLLAQVQKDTPDKVWGSFTTMSAAISGVNNATSPADGPFNVTAGHIIIKP